MAKQRPQTELEQELGLFSMRWYIVEVAFNEGARNIHRAIGFYRHTGFIDLHGHYDSGTECVRISDLHYFRVVRSLDEMNDFHRKEIKPVKRKPSAK